MNYDNGYTVRDVICGLCFGALLITFSYILGFGFQLLVLPELNYSHIMVTRFLIGACILSCFYVLHAIIVIILRIRHNRKCCKLDAMMVMQTYNEFVEAGVKTPLDFCYLMLTTNYCMPINVFNGSPSRLQLIKDIDLYTRTVLVFKEMFGRNPIKADEYDWLSVTIYEIFYHNTMVEEDLIFEDLKKLVSPKVLSFPTRFTQEWCLEIQRQFKPRCQELARKLEANKKKEGGLF